MLRLEKQKQDASKLVQHDEELPPEASNAINRGIQSIFQELQNSYCTALHLKLTGARQTLMGNWQWILASDWPRLIM